MDDANDDEAALLAELRAVSLRSSAAGRFQEEEAAAGTAKEDDCNNGGGEGGTGLAREGTAEGTVIAASAAEDARPGGPRGAPSATVPMSPWKKFLHKASSSSHHSTTMTTALSSAAETPEQPPSQQQSSVLGQASEVLAVELTSADPAPRVVDPVLPPRKQKVQHQQIHPSLPPVPAVEEPNSGSAQDAELLALLRGVSARSAGANRFEDLGNDDNHNNTNNTRDAEPTSNPAGPVAESRSDDDTVITAEPTTAPSSSALRPNQSPHQPAEASVQPPSLPPWKQKRTITTTDPKGSDARVGDVVEGSAEEAGTTPPPTTEGVASTGAGETRGGPAQDAELLALLRGVSAQSSSASRFDATSGDDAAANAVPSVSTTMSAAEVPPVPTAPPPREGVVLPPWKRRNAIAAEPQRPEPSSSSPPPNGAAQVPPQPTTTARHTVAVPATHGAAPQGNERGGPAEDAELLALLRGVSAQSSSASRFDDDNTNGDGHDRTATTTTTAAAADPAEPRPNQTRVPPWKKQPRGEMAARSGPTPPSTSTAESNSNAPVELLFPSPGFRSRGPSTFQGERGGPAEDAELLALLRGVSAKSSSANRFDDDNNNNDEGVAAAAETAAVHEPAQPHPNQAQVPPWKKPQPHQRGGTTAARSAPAPKQVTDNPAAVDSNAPMDVNLRSTGFQSNVPSAFQGERGGAAEDAELLALLRGVSAKSSSADRFDDNNADEGANAATVADESPLSPHPSHPPLPPWKKPQRGGTAARSTPVPPPKPSKSAEPDFNGSVDPTPPNPGFQSTVTSTFHGERGGPAADAELLALLRGVSAKSSSASRFNDDDSTAEASTPAANPPSIQQPQPSRLQQPGLGTVTSPPRRSGESAPTSQSLQQAEPIPSFGIPSESQSTFRGERGGTAEDPELLALLRGVSQSHSASRFLDESSNGDVAETLAPPRKPSPAFAPQTSSSNTLERQPDIPLAASAMPLAPNAAAPVAPGSEDVQVNRENLGPSLQDKNWKVRVKALELMASALTASVQKEQWNFDANQLAPGLVELMPKLLEDANASALDKTLEFALLYAEHCSAAGNADHTALLVSSLVQKNGLSSRPTTLKLATTLTLKLMEVGMGPGSSIHSIVGVLLTEGLASKKPKVVQAAASLIHEAAMEFGASNLPLALIVSHAPKMLAHSNPGVRSSAIQILAEVCRSLGSKAPIQDVVAGMKKAQLTELDALLSERPEPLPPKRRLRCTQSGSKASQSTDSLSSLHVGAEELAAQRFAARPAVDVISAVAKTEFSSRIGLSKWSEKVAALNMVLECGGEKPYKLVPHTSSLSYAPLISELKKLLAHTHFAVCSKAMEVLAMLASGVGETLFPHLRPLLCVLLKISKDKKLTTGVSSCLDSFFGTILGFEHLFDRDDGLPSLLDEQKEKNALVRTTAMEYLGRCVQRNDAAGPRGALTPKSAIAAATLCVDKVDDSNAAVRKAVMMTMKALSECGSSDVQRSTAEIFESLKEKNPRAQKALSALVSTSKTEQTQSARTHARAPLPKTGENVPSKRFPPVDMDKSHKYGRPIQQKAQLPAPPTNIRKSSDAPAISVDMDSSSNAPNGTPLNLDRALSHVATLRIPQWDAPEDDGGVLSGLVSSKWMYRQDAVKSMTAFIESGQLNSSVEMHLHTYAILTVVAEHTRGFKETNVNIMKSIIQLFRAVCEAHEATENPINGWVADCGVDIAVSKMSDKKLCDGCKTLLTSLCVVSPPYRIVLNAFGGLKSNKSPIAHEEVLKWVGSFFHSFGAAALGSRMGEVLPLILEECGGSNIKVKREAFLVLGAVHKQVGPTFKAISLSLAKPAMRDELEKMYDENPFDRKLQDVDFPKRSLCDSKSSENGNANSDGSVLILEIPRMDLQAAIGDDYIQRLGSKEGKASWKVRKEALDELDSALKSCSGLLETSGSRLKFLIDLSRALRDRLSDTQINLKPLAARVIGVLLSVVDKATQAKLGKVFYSSLINACMHDIKKPMRDAALEALRVGTIASALAGGGPNEEGLEYFVSSLVSEVNETTSRAGGLADVLQFVIDMAESLPNLSDVASTQGQSLGDKFGDVLVECLTSTKSETRAAAMALLDTSIERAIIGVPNMRKAAERLKPAKQRTIGPIIAKYASRTAILETGKENSHPSAPVDDQPEAPNSTSARQTSQKTDNRPAAKQSSAPRHLSENAAPGRHPLLSRSCNSQRITFHPVSWIEFPEEPNVTIHLNALKQAWSSVLPPSSAAALFPSSGIRKQDDALQGCDVLTRAIEMDKVDGCAVTASQLDMVLRWLAIVLCCKEATVGLQAILQVLQNLLSLAIEHNRQLSDAEALVIAPFLIEKASNAKGRFRDLFMELVSVLQVEELLPTRTFGAIVCVAVVERSSHSRARALACRLCSNCVEIDSLAGVGKRGVLALSKALSDETVPENKAAALEAMMTILSKLNGDMTRLDKICGSNLSAKARMALEERWAKVTREDSRLESNTMNQETIRSPVHLRDSIEAESPGLQDQLPALSLRDRQNLTSQNRIHQKLASQNPASAAVVHDLALNSAEPSNSSGSAAALRARLLKLRETSQHPADRVAPPAASFSAPGDSGLPCGQDLFDAGIDRIQIVISMQPPVQDENEHVLAAIQSIKQFHAALSKQEYPAAGLSVLEMNQLREQITVHLHETAKNLTSVIRFAFDCGPRSINAGMSVPLLSVCLATLMALFRDPDLSVLISLEDLMLLIREAGTALLDSRLAASSELDEATSSQMVRAINKLAVQGATGASRNVALQSLLLLQHQILSETAGMSDEADTLNSRLSRVISKLFARVIKAEEAMPEPYSADTVDLEALICSIEDTLVARRAHAGASFNPSNDALWEMSRALTESIVNTFGSAAIIHMAHDLHLELNTSHFMGLVQLCDGTEEDNSMLVPSPSHGSSHSNPSTPPAVVAPVTPTVGTGSTTGAGRDVASLVSALASAPQGPGRDQALEALRAYTSSHGEAELADHLRDVSSPFRAFIEQQLRGANAASSSSLSSSSVAVQGRTDAAPTSSVTGSMSARLRSLRSRLEATEMAVQFAVDEPKSETTIGSGVSAPRENDLPAVATVSAFGPTTASSDAHPPPPTPPVPTASVPRSGMRLSRLAPPTPSKLLPPSQSKRSSIAPTTSSSSVASSLFLRDRLAAAAASGGGEATAPPSALTGAAGHRAAALRARLEAVKQQQHQQQPSHPH